MPLRIKGYANRRIETPPLEVRYFVLVRDGWRCVYCRWEADCTDHIIPRGYPESTNLESNLVASCRSCNTAASNRIFKTLDDRKRFVREYRKIRSCRNCLKLFTSKVWWHNICNPGCTPIEKRDRFLFRRWVEGRISKMVKDGK